jgi:HEAT repeat protein
MKVFFFLALLLLGGVSFYCFSLKPSDPFLEALHDPQVQQYAGQIFQRVPQRIQALKALKELHLLNSERSKKEVNLVLIQALQSEFYQVREKSAEILGERCPPEAFLSLLESLSDPHKEVQQQAAKALAQYTQIQLPKSGVLLFEKAFREKDPVVCYWLLECLARWKASPELWVEKLLGFVHPKEALDLRIVALETLGKLGYHPQSLILFLSCLKENSVSIQEQALIALEHFGLEAHLALPFLEPSALEKATPSLRSKMEALSKCLKPTSLQELPVLLQGLNSSSLETQEYALSCCKPFILYPQELIPPLLRLTKTSSLNLYQKVCTLLEELSFEERSFQKALILALEQKDAVLYAQVHSVLEGLGKKGILDFSLLAELLQDRELSLLIRSWIVEALARYFYKDPQTIALLKEVVETDSDLQQKVAHLLKKLTHIENETQKKIKQFQTMNKESLRRLHQRNVPKDMGVLLKGLSHENPAVREKSAWEIASQGKKAISILPYLEVSLKDSNAFVREAIAQALFNIFKEYSKNPLLNRDHIDFLRVQKRFPNLYKLDLQPIFVALVSALEDESLLVQEWVRKTILEIGEIVLPTLQSATQEETHQKTREFFQEWKRLLQKERIPHADVEQILNYLEESDLALQKVALLQLGSPNIGVEARFFPLLKKKLYHEDPQIRESSAWTLCQIVKKIKSDTAHWKKLEQWELFMQHSEQAQIEEEQRNLLPFLIQALADPVPSVSYWAQRTLLEFGSSIQDVLEKAQEDPHEKVREEVRSLLETLLTQKSETK